MSLSSKHCVPCEGGTKPLTQEEYAVYLPQVPDWNVAADERSISKEFVCANFADAIERIKMIARIAESEGHHPDLLLHDYKKLTLTLSTHAIGGLSINDFILATKIDELFAPDSTSP